MRRGRPYAHLIVTMDELERVAFEFGETITYDEPTDSASLALDVPPAGRLHFRAPAVGS